MKKILTLAIAVTSTAGVQAQTWTIDNAHSQVLFTVSHLVISEVTGNFKSFSGNITSTKPDFSDASVAFTIDVNSINTDNEMRDTHLKSDDFFNAEKFPKITFKGNGLKKISGNKYQITGQLTIRDITKTVTFDVTYSGTAKDGYGNTKAGFKIRGEINRFDYNLKWNALTEAGGVTVGETVEFVSNLQLVQGK